MSLESALIQLEDFWSVSSDKFVRTSSSPTVGIQRKIKKEGGKKNCFNNMMPLNLMERRTSMQWRMSIYSKMRLVDQHMDIELNTIRRLKNNPNGLVVVEASGKQ